MHVNSLELPLDYILFLKKNNSEKLLLFGKSSRVKWVGRFTLGRPLRIRRPEAPVDEVVMLLTAAPHIDVVAVVILCQREAILLSPDAGHWEEGVGANGTSNTAWPAPRAPLPAAAAPPAGVTADLPAQLRREHHKKNCLLFWAYLWENGQETHFQGRPSSEFRVLTCTFTAGRFCGKMETPSLWLCPTVFSRCSFLHSHHFLQTATHRRCCHCAFRIPLHALPPCGFHFRRRSRGGAPAPRTAPPVPPSLGGTPRRTPRCSTPPAAARPAPVPGPPVDRRRSPPHPKAWSLNLGFVAGNPPQGVLIEKKNQNLITFVGEIWFSIIFWGGTCDCLH